MADIILKDRNGNDVTYEGANMLMVYDVDGNPTLFSLGVGGASSWDELTDKPFYEEVYEDSYDFAVIPTVYFDAGGNRFYKISDLTLTNEQLLKTTFTLVSGESTESVIPTDDMFLFNSAEVAGFINGNITIGVAYTTGEVETDFGVFNIPETGTYFGFYPVDFEIPTGTVVSIRYEDLKTLDVKFLPDEATDWDALKNKPFGSDITVYYEHTEGYTPLDSVLVNSDTGLYAYKVSNTPLTTDDLVGCSGSLYLDGETIEGIITEDMLTVTADFILSDFAVSVLAETFTMDGITLSMGVWVMHSETQYVSKLYKEVITPLPEKYLPEVDALPSVTTADNGKHLEVENGEWTVKELPDIECLPTVTTSDDSKHLEVENGLWVAKLPAQKSWNDITDKPFGETVYSDSYDFTVTPEITFDVSAVSSMCYKFSDLTLDYNQLLSTKFSITNDGEVYVGVPTESDFLVNTEDAVGFDITLPHTVTSETSMVQAFFVSYKTGTIATDFGTIDVPETGTYLLWKTGSVPFDSGITTISVEYTELKKLDGKYLPEIDILPEITEEDDGKVLGVQDGVWQTIPAPDTLPAVTESDNGKTLGVVGGVWTVTDDETVVNLPTVTTADNGKFLQVVDGEWAAVTITNGNEVAW